jgi:hypothetical protein
VGAACYKAQPEEKSKRTTRLVGDDRRTGKNMRRPHQLVAVDGVGGAKMKRLEKDMIANDGEKLPVPGFVDLLEDLPEEFTFPEPYSMVRGISPVRFFSCFLTTLLVCTRTVL